MTFECVWEWFAGLARWVKWPYSPDCPQGQACAEPANPGTFDGEFQTTPCV